VFIYSINTTYAYQRAERKLLLQIWKGPDKYYETSR
jgi:hypothetical protein